MISNEYLRKLFECNDENFAINDLLNKLNELSPDFVEYIRNNAVLPKQLTEEELIFITKITSLIEYFFIKNNIDIPDWVQDERYVLKEPYVFGARKKDIWYLKTILSAHTVFKSKNVYFDPSSLYRI